MSIFDNGLSLRYKSFLTQCYNVLIRLKSLIFLWTSFYLRPYIEQNIVVFKRCYHAFYSHILTEMLHEVDKKISVYFERK